MCMHWHDTLVCKMYWVQTQISVKNNKQTKNLLCVQMQVEDAATLHMRADGLRACVQMRYMWTWISVIKKKERKNLLTGKGCGHNVRTSCMCTRTWTGDVGALVVGRDACACGWTPYADLMDTDEYKQKKKHLPCVCRRAWMGDVDMLRVRADGLRMQN